MTGPELVAKKLALIEDVELEIVKDIVLNRLPDLEEFVRIIRGRL